MSKNVKKDSGVKRSREVGSGFGRDRDRINRGARIMAIVMVILMVAFTFLTAGIFMLG